jgi:hypothetical protein
MPLCATLFIKKNVIIFRFFLARNLMSSTNTFYFSFNLCVINWTTKLQCEDFLTLDSTL